MTVLPNAASAGGAPCRVPATLVGWGQPRRPAWGGEREGLNVISSSGAERWCWWGTPTCSLSTKPLCTGEGKMFPAESGFMTATLGTVPEGRERGSRGGWVRAGGHFSRSRATPGLPWPNPGSEKPYSNSSTSSYPSVTHRTGIIFFGCKKVLGGSMGAHPAQPPHGPAALHPTMHPTKPSSAAPGAVVTVKSQKQSAGRSGGLRLAEGAGVSPAGNAGAASPGR